MKPVGRFSNNMFPKSAAEQKKKKSSPTGGFEPSEETLNASEPFTGSADSGRDGTQVQLYHREARKIYLSVDLTTFENVRQSNGLKP